MKNTFAKLQFSLTKIKPSHLKIIWILIVLAMLVLGAGAPEDVGGVGI